MIHQSYSWAYPEKTLIQKDKTRNYKTPRGEHRQNTLWQNYNLEIFVLIPDVVISSLIYFQVCFHVSIKSIKWIVLTPSWAFLPISHPFLTLTEIAPIPIFH